MTENDIIGIGLTLLGVYIVSRIGAYRTVKGVGMVAGGVVGISFLIVGIFCTLSIFGLIVFGALQIVKNVVGGLQ